MSTKKKFEWIDILEGICYGIIIAFIAFVNYQIWVYTEEKSYRPVVVTRLEENYLVTLQQGTVRERTLPLDHFRLEYTDKKERAGWYRSSIPWVGFKRVHLIPAYCLEVVALLDSYLIVNFREDMYAFRRDSIKEVRKVGLYAPNSLDWLVSQKRRYIYRWRAGTPRESGELILYL